MKIYVVSDYERTNSLLENQSVCLNRWVSIPPNVMKSQSNMEIFYYLKQRWYNSKATAEQTTKGLKPIRQTAHGDTCANMARFELKLHKPVKGVLAFIIFI